VRRDLLAYASATVGTIGVIAGTIALSGFVLGPLAIALAAVAFARHGRRVHPVVALGAIFGTFAIGEAIAALLFLDTAE
jgi:hypothetical protein